MDWEAAIEWNRQALMRVLAALIAMVGSGSRSETKSPETGFSSERTPEAVAEGLASRFTLPRHLYRAVLRLLRPAEAATRRLVIAAARGLVMTLPAVRFFPASLRKSTGRPRTATRPGKVSGEVSLPPRPGFRLFDPLPRFRPARPAQAAVPRISAPGFTRPFFIPVRQPPSPQDRLDATRLELRLAALGQVLDDLPRHARRFARWKARLKQGERGGSPLRKGCKSRTMRIWPLRPGRPPGSRRRSGHEVHTVLRNAHGLALSALGERRDTS